MGVLPSINASSHNPLGVLNRDTPLAALHENNGAHHANHEHKEQQHKENAHFTRPGEAHRIDQSVGKAGHDSSINDQ